MSIGVDPARFTQFGQQRPDDFFLVTDEELVGTLAVRDNGSYGSARVLGLPRDISLASLLDATVPDGSDVVVACPGRFLTSLSAEELGARRLAVLPAGSTSLGLAELDYFLTTAQRTDARAQAEVAEAFFARVGAATSLHLTDDATGTAATFDHLADEYSWNQQAGELEAGDQQILPAGELSVLPMDIMEFAEDARLAMTGALTLSGLPIVHRYGSTADAVEQARLFEALRGLATHPVVLHLAGGVIERVTPAGDGGRAVAAALDDLLASDPRYRTVWELGFGINTDLKQWRGNCGPNEVYGATSGVVHIGLGLTPTTRFALTFGCQGTVVSTDAGHRVFGGATRTAAESRLTRVRSASCGCH